MMKESYAPQTPAEALSRLIGSLREEAARIEAEKVVTLPVLARAKTIEREIVFLEAIAESWEVGVLAQRWELAFLQETNARLMAEIAADQKTAGERPESGGAGKETAQPESAPIRSELFEASLAETGEAEERGAGDPVRAVAGGAANLVA